MAKKDLINRDNNEPRPSRGQIALRILFGKTIPQKMFRVYLLAIIIGAILLYLPISLEHGYHIYSYQKDTNDLSGDTGKVYTFWDSLLISCSALSTTGLTPLELSVNLTPFGQVVIFVLFELGGIGLLSIIYCLWSLFKRKSRDQLAETVILQAERGNEKIAGTMSTLKRSILLILVIQIFFAFLMSFWLCFMPLHHQVEFTNGISSIDDPNHYISAHHNYGKAFWQGLFMSGSAINNGGFDILDGESSLGALRNDWNVIFQLMILIELIIGGIGYPLIFDFWEKAKYRHKGLKYRISLFTKICLLGFIVVTVVGLAFTFGFEYGFKGDTINIVGIKDNAVAYHVQASDVAYYSVDWSAMSNNYNFNTTFGKNTEFNKAFAIFFNAMTTRSAGFTTVSMNTLSPGSQWTYIILMFIGGSPSSTAGGIRTTTLVIAVASIVSLVKGKKEVTLFHRTVPQNKVRASFIVIITGVAVVCLFAICIYLTSNFADNNLSTGPDYTVDGTNGVLEAFFEAASAIGTVGASMGLTPTINDFGLVLLMILMFIGYLGISSTLLSWTKKNPRGNLIKYAEEDVRIG